MFVAEFTAMTKTLTCICFVALSLVRLHAQESLTGRLNAFMDEAVQKDLFSGNALVLQDGKVVWQKTTGMADRAQGLPNTMETGFSLGSITKLFTKVVILQLVAEGKIDLNSTLGAYLDGFQPEIAGRVKISHLMNHQSGFGQYYDVPDFNPEETTVQSASDFLPWIRREALLFEPGTGMEYSNSGFVLLAAVAEKATGKPYAEILQSRIFDKLAMRSTGFLYRPAQAPGKALGYLSNQPGPMRDNLGFPLLGGGDGGIYSTLGDMLEFDRSLAGDNRLLSDTGKLQLFNDPLFPGKYADWPSFQNSGNFAVAGGGPGVSAVYSRNNLRNRTVVVLSNYDEGSAETVFQGLDAILNDMPVPALQPSASKFIYSLLTEKGADYFTGNIETELEQNGYSLDDDMVLLFAGAAILEEGKADEAIALYRFYTEKFPRIVVAWNDLGDAYLLKNDRENAKMCFEKALEIRPGNPRAKENLEKINKN